ncbi:MAG: arsenic resistance N-acetyltransferase ArsN2 [Candidatus Thorarchaeota archaeon]|nr:arsenic resistance N-acetyltransferase ArsN2 [Candidatus Thorarchaeota archaeon]
MTRNLRIEKAKNSDYSALVDLLKETNLPPDGIEAHLMNFLVIRNPEADISSGFLVGSVGLEIYGNSALFRSLAVHPDFQRAGLGSQLVDQITKLAKKKGITRLYLLTDTAEEYFKRKGFLIVTRDKIPSDMKQSVEFTTLCTSSPSLMKEI